MLSDCICFTQDVSSHWIPHWFLAFSAIAFAPHVSRYWYPRWFNTFSAEFVVLPNDRVVGSPVGSTLFSVNFKFARQLSRHLRAPWFRHFFTQKVWRIYYMTILFPIPRRIYLKLGGGGREREQEGERGRPPPHGGEPPSPTPPTGRAAEAAPLLVAEKLYSTHHSTEKNIIPVRWP